MQVQLQHTGLELVEFQGFAGVFSAMWTHCRILFLSTISSSFSQIYDICAVQDRLADTFNFLDMLRFLEVLYSDLLSW